MEHGALVVEARDFVLDIALMRELHASANPLARLVYSSARLALIALDIMKNRDGRSVPYWVNADDDDLVVTFRACIRASACLYFSLFAAGDPPGNGERGIVGAAAAVPTSGVRRLNFNDVITYFGGALDADASARLRAADAFVRKVRTKVVNHIGDEQGALWELVVLVRPTLSADVSWADSTPQVDVDVKEFSLPVTQAVVLLNLFVGSYLVGRAIPDGALDALRFIQTSDLEVEDAIATGIAAAAAEGVALAPPPPRSCRVYKSDDAAKLAFALACSNRMLRIQQALRLLTPESAAALHATDPGSLEYDILLHTRFACQLEAATSFRALFPPNGDSVFIAGDVPVLVATLSALVNGTFGHVGDGWVVALSDITPSLPVEPDEETVHSPALFSAGWLAVRHQVTGTVRFYDPRHLPLACVDSFSDADRSFIEHAATRLHRQLTHWCRNSNPGLGSDEPSMAVWWQGNRGGVGSYNVMYRDVVRGLHSDPTARFSNAMLTGGLCDACLGVVTSGCSCGAVTGP